MESMDTLVHLTSKSQRKSLYSDFCSSVFLQVPLISKWLYIPRFGYSPFGRAAAGCLKNAHTCESFLSPSWDYYSQCHWPRCVRRWADNHSASDVNGSGGQSTQLGHGETLTFWILFLNPSPFFFFLILNYICKNCRNIRGAYKSSSTLEGNNLWKRLRVTTPSPLC